MGHPRTEANADAATGASIAPSAPLTAAAVLMAAADLIEPEGRWTQGVQARDVKGNAWQARDPSAVCWCLDGAIQKVTPSAEGSLTYKAYSAVGGLLGYSPIAFNDTPGRTQAEVVAALRQAAELAEADQ